MKNVLRLAAAVALLLTSAPALAQGRGAPRTGLTNAAVLLGFEDGGPESGLALRGDVEFMPTPLAPNANLSLVLSLGLHPLLGLVLLRARRLSARSGARTCSS